MKIPSILSELNTLYVPLQVTDKKWFALEYLKDQSKNMEKQPIFMHSISQEQEHNFAISDRNGYLLVPNIINFKEFAEEILQFKAKKYVFVLQLPVVAKYRDSQFRAQSCRRSVNCMLEGFEPLENIETKQQFIQFIKGFGQDKIGDFIEKLEDFGVLLSFE